MWYSAGYVSVSVLPNSRILAIPSGMAVVWYNSPPSSALFLCIIDSACVPLPDPIVVLELVAPKGIHFRCIQWTGDHHRLHAVQPTTTDDGVYSGAQSSPLRNEPAVELCTLQGMIKLGFICKLKWKMAARNKSSSDKMHCRARLLRLFFCCHKHYKENRSFLPFRAQCSVLPHTIINLLIVGHKNVIRQHS